MKKTLFTILALSSLAFANDDILWTMDLTSTLPSETVMEGLTVSAWTAYSQASSPAERVTLVLKDTAPNTWPEFSRGELLPNYILNDDNKAVIYSFSITNTQQEAITLKGITLGVFAAANDGTAQGSARYGKYVLTMGNSDPVTQTITISKNTKPTITILSPYIELGAGESVDVELKLMRNGGNQFYSGLTSLTIIPEPATATLSLLALAGLAARRRRK